MGWRIYFTSTGKGYRTWSKMEIIFVRRGRMWLSPHLNEWLGALRKLSAFLGRILSWKQIDIWLCKAWDERNQWCPPYILKLDWCVQNKIISPLWRPWSIFISEVFGDFVITVIFKMTWSQVFIVYLVKCSIKNHLDWTLTCIQYF